MFTFFVTQYGTGYESCVVVCDCALTLDLRWSLQFVLIIFQCKLQKKTQFYTVQTTDTHTKLSCLLSQAAQCNKPGTRMTVSWTVYI